MRLEIVRMIADWLLDSTYGVNAYLPSVPRDVGDSAPPNIADWNSTLAVFDETRHLWVVQREPPPAVPALYVMCDSPVNMIGQPYPNGDVRTTNNPVAIAIRYLTSQSDRVQAHVDGEYTLRGVLRSIAELMKNANEASRTRNSIQLIAAVDPTVYFPIEETVGESTVSGAVLLNVEARDVSPSY